MQGARHVERRPDNPGAQLLRLVRVGWPRGGGVPRGSEQLRRDAGEEGAVTHQSDPPLGPPPEPAHDGRLALELLVELLVVVLRLLILVVVLFVLFFHWHLLQCDQLEPRPQQAHHLLKRADPFHHVVTTENSDICAVDDRLASLSNEQPFARERLLAQGQTRHPRLLHMDFRQGGGGGLLVLQHAQQLLVLRRVGLVPDRQLARELVLVPQLGRRRVRRRAGRRRRARLLLLLLLAHDDHLVLVLLHRAGQAHLQLHRAGPRPVDRALEHAGHIGQLRRQPGGRTADGVGGDELGWRGVQELGCLGDGARLFCRLFFEQVFT
mmetsp:Transcript_18524/g.42641  ORF Transcript_18524/g.42641 Transcript_18524/m.42641 type:complete len:323 (+) Transcript_18524:528-1496(+)